MINFLNLAWLVECQAECQKTLRKLSGELEFATQIVNLLDDDPSLRNELSNIYTRAMQTIEESVINASS